MESNLRGKSRKMCQFRTSLTPYTYLKSKLTVVTTLWVTCSLLNAIYSSLFFRINVKWEDSPTGPVAIWCYCCTSWKNHFIIVGYSRNCSDLRFISRIFSSLLMFANLLQHHTSTDYVLLGFILWISSSLEGSTSWKNNHSFSNSFMKWTSQSSLFPS